MWRTTEASSRWFNAPRMPPPPARAPRAGTLSARSPGRFDHAATRALTDVGEGRDGDEVHDPWRADAQQALDELRARLLAVQLKERHNGVHRHDQRRRVRRFDRQAPMPTRRRIR